jgi:hypothetical protein
MVGELYEVSIPGSKHNMKEKKIYGQNIVISIIRNWQDVMTIIHVWILHYSACATNIHF